MPSTPSREEADRRNRRLFAEAAAIIDSWPDVRDRLRACHVPDRRGRCSGCRSAADTHPRWPCALAIVSGATSDRPRTSRR